MIHPLFRYIIIWFSFFIEYGFCFSIFPYSHASCWYNVCRWLMFVKVEILQVLQAYSVEHIVEVSQTFDMYALALCHAHIHAGRNASQHGLNVRVTYCGDARQQVLGNRLRFHRFLLHDGAGVVNFLFCYMISYKTA